MSKFPEAGPEPTPEDSPPVAIYVAVPSDPAPIVVTSADLPPIRVFFEETPYAFGPGGAKGIGELPMDGVAPAILNAVEHATGVSFDTIPLTPERVMESLLPEPFIPEEVEA